MTYSGSGGERRPPIYDISLAITSPLELERPPTDVMAEARELALSSRFVKVRSGKLEVWVYLGPREDHLLVAAGHPKEMGKAAEEPVYCSCEAFQLRFISEERSLACKHVHALRLVLRGLATHAEVELKDPGQLAEIINEVIDIGRSVTLRKVLSGLVNDSPS